MKPFTKIGNFKGVGVYINESISNGEVWFIYPKGKIVILDINKEEAECGTQETKARKLD